MKKIILFSFLILLSIASRAQFPADLAALRAQNNTQITTQTGFHAVTHTIEGNIIDTTLGMILRLYSLSAGAMGLNQVLSLGNIDTNQHIFIKNSSFVQTMDFDPLGAITIGETTLANIKLTSGNILTYQGGLVLGGILNNTTSSLLRLRSPSGSYYDLVPSSITASRKALWPDEGAGVGIPDMIMLHTTQYPVVVNNASGVIVNDGSGDVSISNGISIGTQDPIGNSISLNAGGYGINTFIEMHNSIGGHLRLYYPLAGALNQYYFKDIGGGTDTIALMSDVIAGNRNFANYDLRLPGNRFHHFVGHKMSWDSVLSFIYNDNIGNVQLFQINNGNPISTTLLSLDAVNNKVVLGTLGQLTNFTSQNSGGTKTAGIQCGALNTWGGASGSGFDWYKIILNSVQLFGADSAKGNVSIRHLTGSTGFPGIAPGAGAGTGPTITINGDDLGGYITITTGTAPTAASIIATVTFAAAFTTAPQMVIITAANINSAFSGTNGAYVDQAGITTTTFDLTVVGTLLGTTTYQYYYFIKQ